MNFLLNKKREHEELCEKEIRADSIGGTTNADSPSIGDFPTMRAGFQKISHGTKIGPGGRYVIKDTLGKGGMGEVYLALDEIANTDVAVKLVPREVSTSEDEMEQVRKNFALVRNLHHPNIAAVTALERLPSGENILIMEAVLGRRTLYKDRLSRKKERYSVPEAIGLCKQIAEALDYAHKQKVIHRDVKPSNVLLTPKGKVKLTDFGLAALIMSSMNRVSTSAMQTSGTRPYMAPEQWEGSLQDAKTDQWSLAVLFYELVTGRLPFPAADLGILEKQITEKTPQKADTLSSSQWRALLRSLSKNQDRRFGTCVEFVDTLSGARKIRHTKIFLAVAGLLILCGAIVAVVFLRTRHMNALWLETEQAHTESAFSQFAQKYPNSHYAAQARRQASLLRTTHQEQEAKRIAAQEMEVAWMNAQASGKAAAYSQFAIMYTNSPYATQAQHQALLLRNAHQEQEAKRIAIQEMEVAWINAQAAGTENAYSLFTSNYPDSSYTEKARQKAMQAAWRIAQSHRTDAAYSLFASTYTNSPYTVWAEQQAARLKGERQSREARYRANQEWRAAQEAKRLQAKRDQQQFEESMESAWKTAQAHASEAIYNQFADEYPKSPYAAKARERAMWAAFEALRTRNTESAYSQFALKYPDSSNAKWAREQAMWAAWRTVHSSGSEPAYRQFALKYPNSPNAEWAERKAVQLRAVREQREAMGLQFSR